MNLIARTILSILILVVTSCNENKVSELDISPEDDFGSASFNIDNASEHNLYVTITNNKGANIYHAKVNSKHFVKAAFESYQETLHVNAITEADSIIIDKDFIVDYNLHYPTCNLNLTQEDYILETLYFRAKNNNGKIQSTKDSLVYKGITYYNTAAEVIKGKLLIREIYDYNVQEYAPIKLHSFSASGTRTKLWRVKEFINS